MQNDVATIARGQCERCAGSGELIVDWNLYMHGRDGVSADDEAVTDCPDCDGYGDLDEREAAIREPTAHLLTEARNHER